ncbi:RNA polymerase factor sigma-54 [Desulfosudis oleivorans]|uniref:RNA polymerase, sigma 54 subunit, RpoN n=1 Tax=Desulfosudis oleivorans (strain DSM 6200 / JCM 39069 / Hxd3) TaxID=96561 RepID=A8ZTQ2_DESOH|nr:RNA polymerase factor sigma-54 [Desulfosudis oleivorans]ABW66316.1 RNA polymerase, sigma 54 subunit, RpoN [Desulfosudis oleivorans Hxd3]
MALDLRQHLKLSQQLVMTPQLQMAIRLLQLNRLEMVDMIQQELSENPALEEAPETAPEDELSTDDREAEALPERVEAEKEVSIEEKISDQVEWENYLNEYNSYGGVQFESEAREQPQYESFVASHKSLKDHLLWQFLMTLPTGQEEAIASLIVGNVDDDGYLKADVAEIAATANAPIEQVETILAMLQNFDPPGVCARTLAECLLIQARQLGIDTPVIAGILNNHMKHLESKNYKVIARALKTDTEEIVAAVNLIRTLEPRPGRSFKQEDAGYIIPDIYVHKFENDFVIVLNDDDLPRLHISPYYRQAMRGRAAGSKEAKEYLQEKIRSATWLIKSIQQRQKTIYAVMNSILKFQRDFFEKGVAHLRPMILRDVAEDIGMHESTISRVTTNKYAHTPQGIFELKYFFNSAINRTGADSMASVSVQDKIRQIIKNENPKKPFSDDKIADILKAANINIARRTVTKYREAMGILSSTKRKQF